MMSRLAPWVCLLCAFFAARVGASEVPCPPWDGFSPTPVSQTDIPQALESILAYHKGNGLYARFQEEKTILLLQRPLRSSGELIFLPHKGIYRKLITPFEQEFLITSTAIRRRDNHQRVETSTLNRLPLAKALVEGFLTVFSGSWDSINAHFEVYFASDSQHWRMGLKPLQAILTQMISCIVLEGEQQRVVGLLLREANGDVTRDRFLEAQILTPERWSKYESQFEWEH